MTELAPHISTFLRDYLLRVRPCRIEIEQLAAPLILDFLNDLEHERGNSIGTRNVRLAAFKSFFRYLEHRAPSCLDLARQVQAVPSKRDNEALVDYLDRDELQALLDAPDPATRSGVRDRAMLHLAYAAGLRVSELTGLMCEDLAKPHLDTVHVTGKGRRERVLPLWKQTRFVLRQWLAIRPSGGDPHLFLNARAEAMSRHGFSHCPAKRAIDGQQAHLSPYPEAHLRHAHPGSDRGHPQGIAVAGSPKHPEHRNIPPRRSRGKARYPGHRTAAWNQEGVLQGCARQADGDTPGSQVRLVMVSESPLRPAAQGPEPLQLNITMCLPLLMKET